MAKSKFKFEWPEIHDLAFAPVVQHTARISNAAGDGFIHDVRKGMRGRKRWRGQVKTATYQAMRRNARENTLLRAIGGGV